MKIQIEPTRTAFINDCENGRQNSCVVNLIYTEELNVNNLPHDNKLSIIGIKIKENDEEISQLNRELYIQFRNDNDRLFALFQGTGRLNNPEELKKLHQAMILGDRQDLLVNMVTDIEQKERATEYCAVHASQHALEGLLQRQDAYLTDHPAMGKRMKAASAERMGKEEIIRCITIKLMQRFNLLVHAADVDLFVQFILDPTIQCPGRTIMLGCKTNQFKYILHRFTAFNNDLQYVKVERSGLFLSKQGTPMLAHNLGSTSFYKMNTRHAIDLIFAEFE